MKWIKLERSNDYGCPYLIFPGAGYHDPRPRFDEGALIRVRFPDGAIEVCAVKHHNVAWEEGGSQAMPGIRYKKMPGIEIGAHGVKAWVPIEQVEIEVE